MDASVPLYQVRSLDQVLSRAVAEPRLRAELIGLFAVLACLLAGLGVYGVVSYLVAQRTHEIGVRLSLGASPRDVVRLVVGEGLRPVLVGLACGVAGAWGLGRALESLLFGVSGSDPLSYVGRVVAAAGRRPRGDACPGPACTSDRPDHGAQSAAVGARLA